MASDPGASVRAIPAIRPGRDKSGASGLLGTPERPPLHILRALRKHRWLGVLAALAVFVPAAVIIALQQPVFEASAQVLVDMDSTVPAVFNDRPADRSNSPGTLEAESEVLRSRPVIVRTVQALEIWKHQEYQPAPSLWERVQAWRGQPAPPSTAAAANPEERARAYAGAFVSHLLITRPETSPVVTVTFESSDPTLAADAVNTLVKQYIAQDLEARFAAAKQSTAWLDDQLAEQRKKVEASEAALQQYRERNDAVALDDRQNIVVQKLNDLNTAVTRAKTERIAKEGVYRQVEAARTSGVPLDTVQVIATNASVQMMRGQVAELERQRAELSQRYGDRHPEMIKNTTALENAKARLQLEIDKVVAVVKNDFLAAEAQERNMARALDAQKAEAQNLGRKDLEYGVLEREAASDRQVYETLLQRTRQAGISSDIRASGIRVIDWAEPPAVPVRPDRTRNTLAALFASLLLGLSLVVAREHFDRRLRTPEAIQAELRLPFVGLVPKVELPEGGSILRYRSPGFLEAIRRVRSYVVLNAPRQGGGSLLVTSAAPREGKTTVAVSLARTLADAGERVVLVDADLRRPAVAAVVGIDGAPGLSDYLTRRLEASDIVRPTMIPHLSVVTAGTASVNAADLIGQPRMASLLEHLEREAAWVVIDSPPVMAVADAALLARDVTGVLLVVGTEMVPADTARTAVQHLVHGHARFVGAVLNKVDLDRHASYYPDYYRKEYTTYYADPRGKRNGDPAK